MCVILIIHSSEFRLGYSGLCYRILYFAIAFNYEVHCFSVNLFNIN